MPQENMDGENLTQNNNGNDSVVSKIISRLPEVDTTQESEEAEQETSEEETNVEAETEEKVETETEETEESEESESIGDTLIDEELAEVLGLPKTFIGKPLKDAGKSYKETVKWENENNKQIKNLQRTVEDLVNKLSDKEINQIEKEANAEAADEVPDPVTEPEKFNEWLQKRDDLIMQKVLKKVEEYPSFKAVDEIAIQRMEEETLKSLQAGLPEDVKASDVMNGWFNDNKDDYEVMVKTGLYKNKPKKLIKDILIWYKANSYDSLKNTKESEMKSQVHKKTVENLKAKGNKTKTNFSSNPRPQIEKTSVVSTILKNLEEQAALKNSP